jgi:hypothetical protein
MEFFDHVQSYQSLKKFLSHAASLIVRDYKIQRLWPGCFKVENDRRVEKQTETNTRT